MRKACIGSTQATLLTHVQESRAELSASILQAFLRASPGNSFGVCGRRCLAGNHLRTWCPLSNPLRVSSGSGESWFDPRRGNSQRDAHMSSRVRNFLVKYADDITFDFEKYQPVDENPNKHPFFGFIERKNDRMQHLALLGRLLLVQIAGGPTDIRDSSLSELVDSTQTPDGIDDETYEDDVDAKEVLKTLKLFCEVFKDDPAVDDESGLKEFRIEYFIVSCVMLLDHLRKYYAVRPQHHSAIRQFFYSFYARWDEHKEEDRDIILFSDSRQQDRSNLEIRDRVIRQLFFDHLKTNNVELKTLDSKRLFDEGERIRIYRRDEGRCQQCLKLGRTPEEATVSWSDYQADHILPWVKGGATVPWNGQVLCKLHNASKGGR